MRRPQDVRVYELSDRRYRKASSGKPAARPWVARWVVDGQEASKAFKNRPEADDFRSRLIVAARDGIRFDPVTLLPAEWGGSSETFYEYARAWVARQSTWAPRSRTSAIEALARGIPLMVTPKAPAPPADMRSYLKAALRPGVEPPSGLCSSWLRRWSLPMGKIDAAIARDAFDSLGTKDDGTIMSATTAHRYRTTVHAMLRDALAVGAIVDDPWPASNGVKKRRAEMAKGKVDREALPNSATVASIVSVMDNHQPASRMYQLMTEIVWQSGLRPSEVRALEVDALNLPDEGWGWITVKRSFDGVQIVEETKTGHVRKAPVPPHLVVKLRAWIAERSIDGPLFRTRKSGVPAESNWLRAFHRACDIAGVPPFSIYTLRHCCASRWIDSGMPWAQAAGFLGHSVAVLQDTYYGASEGDEEVALKRLERAMDEGTRW
jgi:integrase